MKKHFLFFLVIIFVFTADFLKAQGYFIAARGEYVISSSFKTNIQSDLSKYNGTYVAASETYESNYTYEITSRDNSLDILIIGAASMDGENWEKDSAFIKGVTVQDGKFTLNSNKVFYGNSGNINFRFVKVTYKLDGKTVKAEGIVMEEYMMFAEKDK
jgi:hypothetical protein